MAESKSDAEALIPEFKFERLLNQDQNGRRISLLGTISDAPALMTIERAAFPTEPAIVSTFLATISNTTNLGANDIYRWYLASHTPPSSSSTSTSTPTPPDLKLNLFYPCTQTHIRKYSPQRLHMVTETPAIYATHIRPYIAAQRSAGRLNWVFNILDGKTEQEDVIFRVPGPPGSDERFLLLPDLNWDRKTLQGLHLLALVERRDIWSLRDLTKGHVGWLKRMRERVLGAVVAVYEKKGWEVEEDELKLYVHYQPTYYHFHIHVVHVMLEAGTTQAVGRAFGLENLISQIESMGGGDEVGMADVDLTYFLGEQSELWEGVFGKLKAEVDRRI